jgi:hypothetical protein
MFDLESEQDVAYKVIFVFNMDALQPVIKGLIVFIISNTIIIVLSVPLSFYRIVDYTLLGGTVLLIVGVMMLRVYFFAKRTK